MRPTQETKHSTNPKEKGKSRRSVTESTNRSGIIQRKNGEIDLGRGGTIETKTDFLKVFK